MENASNAVIMAGSILIFVIALSIAVFLYNSIISTNNQVLTSSEYYDRAAEGIGANVDVTRKISGAEVANEILDMVNKRGAMTFAKIKVEGFSHDFTPSTKDSSIQGDLKSISAPGNYYTAEYDFNPRVVSGETVTDVTVQYSISG